MHDDFYVIATGNPSCFRGRLELPMSLQTRFTTVLLHPIQPEELILIIKDKVPGMPDDDARGWCRAFFEAKRAVPTLTTRALWEALKDAAGCSDGAPEIKPVAPTAADVVVPGRELQLPSSFFDDSVIDVGNLKGAASSAHGCAEIKPLPAKATAAVVHDNELQQPYPSEHFRIDGGRGRIAVCAAATVVVGEDVFVVQVHRWNFRICCVCVFNDCCR